jgi:hypothetical protein
VLVEVRKPGRPLSSCPHPSGSCSCERIVINYTIPKSSECACPSDRAQSIAGNNRIQKPRRKSTAINVSSLEQAIRAGQDAHTDASSYTQTPTERSGSNEPSAPSSASSTPRLSPTRHDSISSCCKPKPVQEPGQPILRQPVQQGGCCSGKTAQPEPVQTKSCCSGGNVHGNQVPTTQPHGPPQFGQQFQFSMQSQVHTPQYIHMQPHMQPHASVPSPFQLGLGAPIYNHAAAAYQRTHSISMNPMVTGPMPPPMVGPHVSQHAPEHNCHCGESCSCFGCAAHPSNATMMEYVRLMAQFQYTGGFGTTPPPLYDLPTYPHHPGYGAEAHHAVPFVSMSQAFSTPTPTQMSFHTSMDMASAPLPPMSASHAWQQPHMPAPSMPDPHFFEPASYVASTPSTDQPPVFKIEDPAPTLADDSPNDGKDEDTPTLSPSSFFWNEMVLPSCSDTTGACQCGDGCECVGCLTHGGHNGVQLAATAVDEHDTFPHFTADHGLHLDDTANFLFEAAPT